jgi:hypothetical protein
VLFSDPQIAQYINEHFEAAWQSVRPVPTVSIDFGNGKVVTKTFRGNIATYVCTADGIVFDILPGVYDRRAYLDRLKLLHDKLQTLVSDNTLDQKLNAYHRNLSKGHRKINLTDALDVALNRSAEIGPEVGKDLLADSSTNESARRILVHRKLMDAGLVSPNELTAWLYKDVLHADLSDPYLGTKELLFAKE